MNLAGAFPTVGAVVVDSTQAPGGCQVLGGHRQVDSVGQIKLHSYSKAALHKHKVPQPVNTHSWEKLNVYKTINIVSIWFLMAPSHNTYIYYASYLVTE